MELKLPGDSFYTLAKADLIVGNLAAEACRKSLRRFIYLCNRLKSV
ncbi:hypothetical protein NEOC65_000280 [Neochlamydia sp. AcF65]|nr:hypothetical protein [Neochlamydia sp. AcF65]MBS4171184.1 hypothetical protein [Neochlamydia sp. AcF95]